MLPYVYQMCTLKKPMDLGPGIHEGENRVKTIGQRIRKMRRVRGITQMKLADMTGISEKTISAVENDRYLPTVDNYFAICDALQVDPRYIYFGEKNDAIEAKAVEAMLDVARSSYRAYKDFCTIVGSPTKAI